MYKFCLYKNLNHRGRRITNLATVTEGDRDSMAQLNDVKIDQWAEKKTTLWRCISTDGSKIDGLKIRTPILLMHGLMH